LQRFGVLRARLLLDSTVKGRSGLPEWVAGPLRTFGVDAKMTTTVLAGGKANGSSGKGPYLAGTAVALVCAFGVLLPVRAGQPKMLRADESYNGRTLKLAVGESLEIFLVENPTTGYRWRLREEAMDSANSKCVLVKDSFEPGRAAVAGQGGIHRWQYQAIQSGTCKIHLEYRRPWEKGTVPQRTFRIRVEVRNGLENKDSSKPSE
jgi:inhibitor of cysteine peptidase